MNITNTLCFVSAFLCFNTQDVRQENMEVKSQDPMESSVENLIVTERDTPINEQVAPENIEENQNAIESVALIDLNAQDALKAAYWNDVLKNMDVNYGYYQSIKYVFWVDKKNTKLQLVSVANGKSSVLGTSDVLVAKGKGHKQKEGDLTTPIGVYNLEARLTNLDPYYGPFALTLDYPNVYDRSLKKTGSGIWIHGKPLDGRKEQNTRGCVVLNNDDLKKYDSIVKVSNTIVIISEGDLQKVEKQQMADILAWLFNWRKVWQDGDINKYLTFYDNKDFMRSDGMKFSDFANYKRKIFAKKERKEIILSNINISPFPNEHEKVMFRVSFAQDYRAYIGKKLSYATSNTKDLYVWMKDGNIKIINER